MCKKYSDPSGVGILARAVHQAMESADFFEASCAKGGVAGGVLYDASVEAAIGTAWVVGAGTGPSICTDGRRGTGVWRKPVLSDLL